MAGASPPSGEPFRQPTERFFKERPHFLVYRLRKQVEIFSNLKNIRMADKAIIESLSKCVDRILAGGKKSRDKRGEKTEHVHDHNDPDYVRNNKSVGN